MTTSVRELTDRQLTELEALFPGRVNDALRERVLYDHDVGTLPGLIRPLLRDTVPAAIVRVQSEEEIVACLRWAAREQVPVVPRAWATSGYGGVIPVRGGIVLDVTGLRQFGEVDLSAMTATVGAGVVWEDVVDHLALHNAAPRILPSSAPASSVGGWLAQGGTGYGAFRYGWFRDIVVSARVVRPDGSIVVLSGDELRAFAGSMGTLGVITSVTFRIRPLEPEGVVGAAFASADDLQRAIAAVSASGLPVWSLSFINPQGAALKNQAPPKLEHGQPGHRGPVLPEQFILIAAFSEQESLRIALAKIMRDAQGTILDQATADHEWGERYRPLKIKRLGPSVIPAEVVLPVAGLGDFFRDLPAALGMPFLTEGIAVSDGTVVLLGFIPHDERTFRFNLAFPLSLTILNRARRLGGRPYAAGLFLAPLAEAAYGKEPWRAMLAAKRELDPRNILNPAKLESLPLLRRMMGWALALEPLLRPIAARSGVRLGERFADEKGIPGDVVWYAYACAQCGYCVKECDQFYGRGWESQSPRGKWSWIKRHIEGHEELTPEQVKTFMICTTCEMCNFRCQLDLPIESSWMKLRGELINERGELTIPPFEVMGASLTKEGNIWAAPRSERAAWVDDSLKDAFSTTAELAYFPGCTASYVEKDIAQATTHLLRKAGLEFQYLGTDENCCGIPMLVSGLWDVWAENMKYNVDRMHERGIKKIVASCPACWLVWKIIYPEWAEKVGVKVDFEVCHYSELVVPAIKSGKITFDEKICEHMPKKVTWHDSCHIGRAGGHDAVYEAPRELITAIPGVELVEMKHNRDAAHCCGSVLTLIGEPAVAHDIGDIRLQEAVEVGVQDVLSLCPCCQFQLRVSADRLNSGVRVHDLAHFAACSLGIKTDDPTPHVMSNWNVFEKMVFLLEPKGLADFMAALFPQMFAAMPAPMIWMMKVAKRVPGMLGVMRLVMPKMLPLIMPMLMPKVMPDMLREMEKRIPMPDYMKAQMPDLMPKAMGSLLPKLLPQVAPIVTPMMIDYIRKEL